MAIVKPFRGLRPPAEHVEETASLPYDVMNSAEAQQMAAGKPRSLLHITRAEIDCSPGTDIHSDEVYGQAVKNFERFKNEGWLKFDDGDCFYIYAQTMNGRTQYGIVGAAAVDDYWNGIIRKHELTRPDKEEDRMVLTRHLNANIEPVFFSYKAVPEIDAIVQYITENQKAEYDFVAGDGFGHTLWVIRDSAINGRLEYLFEHQVPFTYVADGHHRTAAAARLGQEKRAQNTQHSGSEPYNYFMAVHFPDNQLQIIDYNRLVKDLNGYDTEGFLQALSERFTIEPMGESVYRPNQLHTFSLYIDKVWYKITALPGSYDDSDPIAVLDVTILSRQILEPILNIVDLRTSDRIDFVGGIRGLEALAQRVDSGEMRAAFALYPVSMEQLINIADSGNIMPPKTTWFEPKLRSGLVIYNL